MGSTAHLINPHLFPQARWTSHTEKPQFTLTHSTKQNPGSAGSALTLSHFLHLPSSSFPISALPTSGFSSRAQIQYWNHHEVNLSLRNTSLLTLTFLDLVVQRDVLLPYFSNHILPKMVSFLKCGNCQVLPCLPWQGAGKALSVGNLPTSSEAGDSSAECQAVWEDGDVVVHESRGIPETPTRCLQCAGRHTC